MKIKELNEEFEMQDKEKNEKIQELNY